ncbi:MAG: hypothetical protein IJ493_00230 [Clostridia bacterium]|nr:hypothetical protein [Clostridia bacterium]
MKTIIHIVFTIVKILITIGILVGLAAMAMELITGRPRMDGVYVNGEVRWTFAKEETVTLEAVGEDGEPYTLSGTYLCTTSGSHITLKLGDSEEAADWNGTHEFRWKRGSVTIDGVVYTLEKEE